FQNNLKSVRIPMLKSKNTKNFFHIVSIGLCVVFAFIILYYNGLRFHFSLIDVYENRAEASIIEKKMPLILFYIKGWARLFLPILLLYTLIIKERIFFILLLLVAFLNFSFGAAKADAFMIILAIMLYFCYKPNRLNWIPNIFTTLNIMLSLKIMFVVLGSILVFRLMFIPAQLSFIYYDFFSSHELLFLRESLFKWLGILSPYETPIVYIIGDVYFHDPESCANQGLIGDAFANFGWYSLLVYPFLWALLGKVVDGFVKEIDMRIQALLAYWTAALLISGTYFSIFLSGGILPILCLLYLMPRQVNEK
ncbi:MAG: hypothetical protein RR190_03875, partial [Bacteroidales bacterium]